MSNPQSSHSTDHANLNIEEILKNFSSLLSSAVTPNGQDPSSLASTSSLSCFLSDSSGYGKNNQVVSIPSLSLKNKTMHGLDPGSTLKESTCLSLAYPAFYGKNNISRAPSEIIQNISSSFMSLIDSRLRWCTIALLKQAISASSSLPTVSRQLNMIVSLLSSTGSRTTPPVDISTIVTSFQVLPFHDVANIEAKERVLPLVMNTIVDLNIFGTLVTVSIQAPGTISGSFSDSADGLLSSVVVSFDTMATLDSMMKQARFAVKKAISLASTLASSLVASMDSNLPTNKMSLSRSGSKLSSSLLTSKVPLQSNPEKNNASFSMPPPAPRPKSLLALKDALLQQERGKYSSILKSSMVMPTGLTTAENGDFLGTKNQIFDQPKTLSSNMTSIPSISRRPYKKRKFMSCPSLLPN